MKKFLQFFSFAAMTQVILLLNQVILLPMQIRLWGHLETAFWYAAIALATATTIGDFGLRTAGHVELLRLCREHDPDARSEFQQLWACIRLLVLLVTSALLLGAFLYGRSHALGESQLVRTLLIVAYALETVLIIRIVYLDSLGEYSRAEASYFTFAAVRLLLAVPALLVFKMHAAGLAWLFFGTSVLGLVLQGLLVRIPRELSILSPFPKRLNWRTCTLARYTMAEPCANWVRLSLPVLVIAAIAPAAAVTTFVALRAIYGAARTTIQQVARVASVEVLRFRTAGETATSESLFAFFLMLTGLIGTALAGVITVDNLRLLGLWLKHFDRPLFQEMNLSFALATPFYSYQVIVALSFRIGQLAPMARRQYAYVLYSALFAGAALITRKLGWYLGLLVTAEVALSMTFMAWQKIGGATGYQTRAGLRGLKASFAGAAVVLGLWMAVRHSTSHLFLGRSVGSQLGGLGLLVGALGSLVLCELASNADVIRNLLMARRPGSAINLSFIESKSWAK